VYLVSTSTADIYMYLFFHGALKRRQIQTQAESIRHQRMAGYSGTPLPQKLGIKPGLTVITINAPTNYRRLLGTIPEGVTFSDRFKPDSDFVHIFVKKRSELEKKLSVLREKIADTGTVWVSWPKRSAS